MLWVFNGARGMYTERGGGQVSRYVNTELYNKRKVFNTKYRAASWVRRIDPKTGEVIEVIKPTDRFEDQTLREPFSKGDLR